MHVRLVLVPLPHLPGPRPFSKTSNLGIRPNLSGSNVATMKGPSRQSFSRAQPFLTMPVHRRVRQRHFFGEADAHPKEATVAMKDSHAEKGAHNQALIREVNERIEQVAEDAARPEFLCECADTNCVEAIELSIAEYEAIRSSPVQFPIKPGHDYPEFERVVEEREHYVIVEKTGEAARIVKKLDPRSRST